MDVTELHRIPDRPDSDALSADTAKLLYRAILIADRREALRAQAFAAAIDAGPLPDDEHLRTLADDPTWGLTDPMTEWTLAITPAHDHGLSCFMTVDPFVSNPTPRTRAPARAGRAILSTAESSHPTHPAALAGHHRPPHPHSAAAP
ncbi:hypothetical protein [Azospirillum canadense]|uniref:hypothetical protein n=1 Tax=Azospirillum canadense TaxID=403962 RepID=UPI00222615BF|nr:hypothetical protein [Azospirillum canadense]MCW2242541.1 hypothetical protein [Azospirillum canadense]